MVGSFDTSGSPTIDIDVFGWNTGVSRTITATLENGFTGFLMLRIDYRFLFRMIAHEDFPMGAGIDGEVFFFNHTRSILLHMYDDRGLDAIAATRDALQPVHATHHGWLLDYDRTRIDQTFGGP